jgi:hypothetical protein
MYLIQHSSVHILMKWEKEILKIFKASQNKDELKAILEHKMFGKQIAETYQMNIKIYKKL